MKTVTLIEKLVHVIGQITFDVFIKRIMKGYWEPEITAIRNKLDAGDKEGYDKGKTRSACRYDLCLV